jgi:signal transduction histidine kinase
MALVPVGLHPNMGPLPFPRALRFAGIAAWLGVSLTTAIKAPLTPRLFAWACVSIVFIVAFLWSTRSARRPFITLALQSACAIAMAALFCNGYEGLLLVLLAVQLALSTSSRLGFGLIGVQSLALSVAVAFQWNLESALLLSLPYFGFQVLMFAVVRLFTEERRMREEVVRAHAELVRMQGALAEKSRLEERLRMAQDLHDSLGHHLVTLSLNLEIAAHESQGAARATVRAAQALARALLQDVKDIVHSSKDEAPVDLPCEILRLAEELPRPKLHVICPPDLKVADGRTSRAMLRAVQEIVTNSIRHGEAGNLWITIERTPDQLRLAARDDGQAIDAFEEGFGLSGMRRRLEALGGSLTAAPGAAGGFEVCAALPCRERESQ